MEKKEIEKYKKRNRKIGGRNMEKYLMVLEQIAMELLNNHNHRVFEGDFYNFSVKAQRESNPNNVTIKFFGSKFADEYEYGYSNKFHHDYYYHMDFCFAEIKCHVFYGSEIVMDKFHFEFPFLIYPYIKYT